MSEAVLAAWIGFAGTMLASLIAGMLGWRWLNQQRMQAQLREARSDILFLLEVERIQAEKRNREHPFTALREARRLARNDGYTWSGKNVRSKVKHYNALDNPQQKSGSDHDFLPGLGSLRLVQVV